VWTRLVGGYATDALGVGRGDVRREAVERFLRDAAGGEATSHEGVGLGMQVIVTSPSVVVTALTWERGVVHLAVLAAPGSARHGGSPIASPRARARHCSTAVSVADDDKTESGERDIKRWHEALERYRRIAEHAATLTPTPDTPGQARIREHIERELLEKKGEEWMRQSADFLRAK